MKQNIFLFNAFIILVLAYFISGCQSNTISDSDLVINNGSFNPGLQIFIPADDNNINYYGRFDFSDPKAPKADWPGVYIEAAFTGTSLGLIMSGNNIYLDVFIDGNKVPKISEGHIGTATLMVNLNTEGYIVAADLEDKIHTVRIVKRSETIVDRPLIFNGFLIDEDKLALSNSFTKPELKIEFIGDSYTVGYGNASSINIDGEMQKESGRDCTNAENNAYTNTNLAYGSITAQELNAQYHISAVSGLGVIRNYSGSSSSAFPEYYRRKIIADKNSKWDFTEWVPDIVVVFLGINDWSEGLDENELGSFSIKYQDAYRNLLYEIRTNYPGVKIVCVGNKAWPFNRLDKEVQEIITNEIDDGATDLLYYNYISTRELGCDWHPELKTHSENGIKLASLIRDAGWNN